MLRVERVEPERQSLQRLRSDLVHVNALHAIEQRKPDGAHARIKLRHRRALRHVLAHEVYDAARDLEIVLAKSARRIMHRGATEMLDHARRTVPAYKVRAEDRVRAFHLRIEPEAVQLITEAIADQVERFCQRRGLVCVADHYDLRRPRRTLDDHLQVASDAAVRALHVGRHPRIDERAAHDGRHAIDQRVVDHAVRNRDHAMRAELEHAELRRTGAAADCESRALAKPAAGARNHGHVRNPVLRRQCLQGSVRLGRDARLAEAGTARARRAVRAGERYRDCHVRLARRRLALKGPLFIPERASHANILQRQARR